VQGVHGDVTIPVDQSSGEAKPKKTGGNKPEQKK
jgi:hypothetical protein